MKRFTLAAIAVSVAVSAALMSSGAIAQSATAQGIKQDAREVKAEAKEAKENIKANARAAKEDIKAEGRYIKAKTKAKAKRAKAKA